MKECGPDSDPALIPRGNGSRRETETVSYTVVSFNSDLFCPPESIQRFVPLTV